MDDDAGGSRSRGMVPRVAIVTNVVPSYRAGFYDRLFARTDLVVDVYCQSHVRGMNVRTVHDRYPGRVNVVRALSADKEALAWQFIPWWKILSSYDVVFVDGNPRVLRTPWPQRFCVSCDGPSSSGRWDTPTGPTAPPSGSACGGPGVPAHFLHRCGGSRVPAHGACPSRSVGHEQRTRSKEDRCGDRRVGRWQA